MEIGTEISQKIRAAIKAKLIELGSYVDEELPDYIMVMVANKKTKQQMADDLNLFLGLNTDKFTTWLHGLLGRLHSITTADSAPSQQPQVPPPTDQTPKTTTEHVTVMARPVQNDEANKTSAAAASKSEPRQDRSSVVAKPKSADTPPSFQSQATYSAPVVTVRKSAEREALIPTSTSPVASTEKKGKQEMEIEDASSRKVTLTGRKRKGRSMMSCISVPASSTIHAASKSKVSKIDSQPSTSKTGSQCKSGDHCDSTGSSNLHVIDVEMTDTVTVLPTSEGKHTALKREPITPTTKLKQTIPVTKLEPVTPVTKIEPTTPVTKIEPTTPVTKIEPTSPVAKLEPTTPVAKLEPTDPVTKLEPTTPVTKLEPTTPVPKSEPKTPVAKIEPTTPIAKVEKICLVIAIAKTSPVVNLEKTHLCSNTDNIIRTADEVIDIVSDDSNSQSDVINSELLPSTLSLPDVVSSVSGHSAIMAGNTFPEPQYERDADSHTQYKDNSDIIINSSVNTDEAIRANDSLLVQTIQVSSKAVTPTEQTLPAQPEEVIQTPESNSEPVVKRAVIVEERFGIRKKKPEAIVNAVPEIEQPRSTQFAQPQSYKPVTGQNTDEPELLVREETDEFSEEFQTEPVKVVGSQKSRQRPSQRHQTQAETRHHRHRKHGRDSESTKTTASVPTKETVITLTKNTAARHISSKTSQRPKSSSSHVDSGRHSTGQVSRDVVAKVGRQVSPVSAIKITRTFHSHEQPVQSVNRRQPVHQRLSVMPAPAAYLEKGVSKSAHAQKKKQQMSSVVGTVKQMPNLEPPQEIEEEEYDPYNPAVGNVASVIRVTPRRQLPASQQANKSLLLKAVTEANKSVTAYQPAQPVRKGHAARVMPVPHQNQQYHREQQHRAVVQGHGSALSHRLGITSRSRHKGILELAHARGEHDPMTSNYEYPIRYQPLTVAVRQDADDVILLGVEEPDRMVQWDTEDQIVVEDSDSEGEDQVEDEDSEDDDQVEGEEEEVVERRLVRRERELTDDEEEDISGDNDDDDGTNSPNYPDTTNVVIKREKDGEEDEEENVEEDEIVEGEKEEENNEEDKEEEEKADDEDDDLLLDDPSSSQDEQQLVQSEGPVEQSAEEDAGNVEVIFSQADITVSPDETISQDEELSQDEQTEEEPAKSRTEQSDGDQSDAILSDDKRVSLPHSTEVKSGRSKSSHRVPRSPSDTAVIRPRVEPLSVRSRASVKPVSVPAFQRLGEEPDSRLFIEQDSQPPVARTAPSRRYARQPIQEPPQQKIQYIQHSPVIESADNYQVIQHVYPNAQYAESHHQNPSYLPTVRRSHAEQQQPAFHSQMPVRQPLPTSQLSQIAPQQQYFQKLPPPHYYQKPPPHSSPYLLPSPTFLSQPPPVLPQAAETYQPMRAPATTHIQPASLPAENKPSTRFVVTLDGVNSADFERMEAKFEDDGEESVSMPAVPEVTSTVQGSETVARLSPVQNEVDMSLDDDSGKNPSSGERCRFWPACSSGNTCQFHHPSMPCKTFPNCKFGEKCLYIHPNCKYDATCARKDCPFTHASKRKSLHTIVPKYVPVPQSVVYPAPPTQPPAGNNKPPICKFYPKCTNMNCPFPHPQPCKFGFNCGNRSTCSYYHPSLPKPDKLKWVASGTQSRSKQWSKTDPVSGDK